ncbi:Flagella-related protein FlaI [Methanosarcina barkeri str. Wiesmoor]|uniref:Flagella-related protein FlaI n=2 Tax=Methanosarcina barkeri TaxID=2208 RepID=A0A0E3QJN5_METBA|nr:type II/IV secretion system ATPase subunit [Methanosarcina barkeri]AKB50278.1 Flagella-related protein FlaI [Methanosarcina barkeri str. Wiesmoor]
MSIKAKLQDAVNALNYGSLSAPDKKEEETCSYRIKQTKSRKTIIINCRECDSGSSLNDIYCRKNILGILQKEVQADCLVLSRLYERDYEGEALSLLYTLAGFEGIITAYESAEKVPRACTLPEKKGCELERKEIIAFFAKTVEDDPLKARLEIKRFIQGKMLNKTSGRATRKVTEKTLKRSITEGAEKITGRFTGRTSEKITKNVSEKTPKKSFETLPVCNTCSERFYQMLYEIEEKLSSFPEVPVIKKSETRFLSKGPVKDPKNGIEKTIEKTIGKMAGNLIKDTSGEVALAEISRHFPFLASVTRKEKLETHKCDADELFDYESGIKPHVRPPFSSSRVYADAPENTEFLECYDIDGREGRKLEVSIYRYIDRPEKLYMIRPPEYNLREEDLRLLEKVRMRMIRHRPKDLAFTDPVVAREYFRRMAKTLLEEELLSSGEACSPDELESYADLLARYTNGLGIVEDLLSDARITDVYINAPADKNPVHVVLEGEECVSNVFLSQDDLDALVSRFRIISGRPFGEAIPVLELNLEAFGVRVSVIGDPLSANGLAYAFRKHSLSPWTLPKLINTGSVSPYAAGLLSFLMDGQASVLVAGEVGAGKTSLLSAMLLEIPQKYRILTIEDTNELPIEKLQSLGWKVQGMSSQSSVLKSGAEMSPETALRAALRLGNSALVLGEVRGEEVKVLYEAMQVGKAGNSVIGTIHGSSTENVYERIVHTLGVPPASFKATDAVIICSGIRLEGSMKKLKRVSRIAETTSAVIENPEPSDIFTDIMKYDASQDCLLAGKALEQGQSELIEKIARKWGISIDRALKSIELRARIKEKIAVEGLKKPFLLEAEAVSQANNIFWLLSDSLNKYKPYEAEYANGNNSSNNPVGDSANNPLGSSVNSPASNYADDSEAGCRDDMETLYKQWETWFENFAKKSSATEK